jgi:hypothetical protein
MDLLRGTTAALPMVETNGTGCPSGAAIRVRACAGRQQALCDFGQ